MTDSSWAEFWWNNITGANMVVSKVSEALHENNLVVLCVPDDLPWRYEMRTAIEYSFRKTALSENVLVQTIDAADECGDLEPGKFLLDRFCTSRNVRMGYRDGSSKSIQQYLISNGVLHDSIIWVKGFRPGQAERWLDFCREYQATGFTQGAFLLEVREYDPSADGRSLAVARFDSWVSDYDVQLLNSFILDRTQRYSNNWKKYISTLVACLCESDAEVSAELLCSVDLSREDPLNGLRKIEASELFSSRGRDAKSNHILALYRAGKRDVLEKRIWTAQVRVLFPLIELERVSFITKYHTELERILETEGINQYGEDLTRPEEVELGKLDHLVKTRQIYMPSREDRLRIEALRGYRNSLAHMGRLTPDEIRDLLNP